MRGYSPQAKCLFVLGVVALGHSDHDGARARYNEALAVYRRVGDVLGEANCVEELGDIALAEKQRDEALRLWRKALVLYQCVATPDTRRVNRQAACAARASIGREDLIADRLGGEDCAAPLLRAAGRCQAEPDGWGVGRASRGEKLALTVERVWLVAAPPAAPHPPCSAGHLPQRSWRRARTFCAQRIAPRHPPATKSATLARHRAGFTDPCAKA